ncbi:MAG: enoyl-CoA hydratase [Burkholderiales bacterium]|nr:MAG: enoyl-CoA hydratase [Burkholderiales bacterium]
MTIRTEVRDGICELVFDRAEKKNAITAAMYAALAEGLERSATDGAVRAVLIRGSDSVFTAGNDLEDFLNNPPHGDDSPVFRFLVAISTCPKPIVAAVAGPAVGVGTTMLLHCDLVYAAENARRSLPFAQLGLCPEAASSLLLPALAGHQRAAEKLLLGEPFDAAEAKAIGLVNRVLPAVELIGYARAQAAKLVQLPASSVRTTKRLMKGDRLEPVAARMREEGAAFRAMLASPEAREAFSAFLQKRKPDFSKFE